MTKKIKFLEQIYQSINENNYDFLRKTTFYLAKTYYKKSSLSQNEKNIQAIPFINREYNERLIKAYKEV